MTDAAQKIEPGSALATAEVLLANATLTWREKLAYLTVRFLQHGQVELPVLSLFEPGRYIREMRIPRGVLIIGRVHRLGHECQLLEGKVVHITEEARRCVTAPFSLRTQPGYQLVLYTLTDIVGRTVHENPDEERDLAVLEKRWAEPLEDLISLGREVQAQLTAEEVSPCPTLPPP